MSDLLRPLARGWKACVDGNPPGGGIVIVKVVSTISTVVKEATSTRTMEMNMKKFGFALMTACASLVSTGVMAQVYVGGGMGSSHTSIECSSGLSCDESGTAYKVYGGYDLGSNFGLELGYIDFGKASISGPGGKAELKASAVTLGIGYAAPISGDWGFSGRVGVANVKAKASSPTNSFIGDSETKTKAFFGLGLSYAVTKQLKLEVSGDFTRAELDGDDSSVRALTLGARYDF